MSQYPYQIFKRNFDQFIEETTDRLKLIIHNDITIIYDKKFIHFSDICSIGYKKDSLVPSLFIKTDISNEYQRSIVEACCKHLSELSSIYKEYLIRFSYLNNFFLKIDDNNELFKIYQSVYTEITKFKPHTLDEMVIFVKNIKDKPLYIKLNYGNTKKPNVDFVYFYDNEEVYRTTVSKSDFVDNISYQLSTGNTMIPNEQE